MIVTQPQSINNMEESSSDRNCCESTSRMRRNETFESWSAVVAHSSFDWAFGQFRGLTQRYCYFFVPIFYNSRRKDKARRMSLGGRKRFFTKMEMLRVDSSYKSTNTNLLARKQYSIMKSDNKLLILTWVRFHL